MAKIEQQFVAELRKQLIYEQKKQKRSGIYGFTQRCMAYNSNRIEGSTLTEHQTASIFETGTIMGEDDVLYRTKDIEEMTGHFRMFNYTLCHLDEPLSIDGIKQMHYSLKVGVFEDMANGYPCGEFKNRENRVSTITTSLPQDVPADMAALLQEYNSIGTPTLRDLAWFHAKYENIHPFQDGNGRTGRMILFKESLRHGMVPVIIQDANKAEYTRYLYNAQTKHDLQGLTGYFQKEQQAYFGKTKNMVLPYEAAAQTYTERMRHLDSKFSDMMDAASAPEDADDKQPG